MHRRLLVFVDPPEGGLGQWIRLDVEGFSESLCIKPELIVAFRELMLRLVRLPFTNLVFIGMKKASYVVNLHRCFCVDFLSNRWTDLGAIMKWLVLLFFYLKAAIKSAESQRTLTIFWKILNA